MRRGIFLKSFQFILSLIIFNINLSLIFAQQDIDLKYKWDLTHIYESDQKWEQDFNWVESQIPLYKTFKGKLSNSPQDLLAVLKFDESIGIVLGKLELYAQLSGDLDLRNTHYQAYNKKITMLFSKVKEASAFIIPEILQIPQETLNSWLDNVEDLKLYKQFFDNILRNKSHVLSTELEETISLSNPVLEGAHNIFNLLTNADLVFPEVLGENGVEKVKVSDSVYYSAIYSQNREYRERVYKAYYSAFMQYKNTLSATLSTHIQGLIFQSKIRKYKSTLEAALSANNIPVSVYENLITSVHQNLWPLHRWMDLKKNVLNYEDLHPYDTYISLFNTFNKKYSYEEGMELTLAASAPLGQNYVNDMKYAYDNRWVDVYPSEGKKSGAYNSGATYGVHSYVLLNWKNTLQDVFTLAHEMGHNMHSYYTSITQPYIYCGYSIFVAEVASTLAEAFLLDYLIQNAKTKEEKMALIEQELLKITTTFYRQVLFAEFEKIVHSKLENGQALSADILTDIYYKLYKQYWGDALTIDIEEAYTWARIPHFYYNFYVYQYATSYAASQAIMQKIKAQGPELIEKYKRFLASGMSKYPIDLLKDVGVDMTSSEPIVAVAHRMNELLDELDSLLNEK